MYCSQSHGRGWSLKNHKAALLSLSCRERRRRRSRSGTRSPKKPRSPKRKMSRSPSPRRSVASWLEKLHLGGKPQQKPWWGCSRGAVCLCLTRGLSSGVRAWLLLTFNRPWAQSCSAGAPGSTQGCPAGGPLGSCPTGLGAAAVPASWLGPGTWGPSLPFMLVHETLLPLVMWHFSDVALGWWWWLIRAEKWGPLGYLPMASGASLSLAVLSPVRSVVCGSWSGHGACPRLQGGVMWFLFTHRHKKEKKKDKDKERSRDERERSTSKKKKSKDKEKDRERKSESDKDVKVCL